MRAVEIYSRYFVQFLKAQMTYRAAFFAGVFTDVAALATGLLYIVLLIDGETVTDLRGWNRYEMLFLFGFSYLSTFLFWLLARNLFGFPNRYIIEGQLDRVLLRPLGSLPQVLFESFNLEAIANFGLGLAVVLYAKGQLGWEWNVFDYLWLVIGAGSGGVILLSVFVAVISLSFFFEDRVGLGAPIFNLMGFARYPIDIFHPGIRFFLTFVIPFGFVAFYPATHFYDRGSFEFFCYASPFAALTVATVALTIWSIGVQRYSSTGN